MGNGLKNNRPKFKVNETALGYLFLAPALIVIGMFTILPIIIAIRTSFHETTYAVVGRFVGFLNYISIFENGAVLKNIINSIEYVVLSLLIAIPLGVMIGSFLNRKVCGRTLLRTLIIIPWCLSQTVAALLWKWLLNGNYGLITYWIYGFTEKKIDLFANGVSAKILLVFANVWNSLPVIIILTIAALQSVSKEMIEAAKVDGANGVQAYFKIVLPSIKPTISTAIVMQSIEYFNMVTLLYILTSGGPFGKTQTLSLAAYQNAFDYWHMDVAAAYSIVIFILNILFSWIYIKLMKNHD